MKPLLEAICIVAAGLILVWFASMLIADRINTGQVDHALIESLERQNAELIRTVQQTAGARDGISDQALVIISAICGIVFVAIFKMMLSARIERDRIRYTTPEPPPNSAATSIYYSNPNGDLNGGGYIEYHHNLERR